MSNYRFAAFAALFVALLAIVLGGYTVVVLLGMLEAAKGLAP